MVPLPMPATFDTGTPTTRVPGAAEHENRDRKLHIAGNDPDNEGNGKHDRRVVLREAVDEAPCRSLRVLRLLDELGDPAECRILASPFCHKLGRAIGQNRAGKDRASRHLLGRHRLACDARLVHGSRAGKHRSIDRNLAARLDLDDIGLFERAAICLSERGLRHHLRKAMHGRAGLCERPLLQIGTEEEEEGDSRRPLIFLDCKGTEHCDRHKKVDAHNVHLQCLYRLIGDGEDAEKRCDKEDEPRRFPISEDELRSECERNERSCRHRQPAAILCQPFLHGVSPVSLSF